MLGILLGMVARECIGGPVVRRDIVKEEDTLTYKGDIADMKTIRRSGKVNNFLEDDHDPREGNIKEMLANGMTLN